MGRNFWARYSSAELKNMVAERMAFHSLRKAIMLKIVLLAGFLSVLTMLPVQAQQLSPNDIWERFKLTCRQVFADPDAFL